MVPGDELMADGSFAMERGDVLLPSDVSGSDVIRLGPEDQMQFAEAVLREPEAIPALARALAILVNHRSGWLPATRLKLKYRGSEF